MCQVFSHTLILFDPLHPEIYLLASPYLKTEEKVLAKLNTQFKEKN